MGVKRAVDKTLSVSGAGAGPIYTLGPLIHNRQAVERLAARGVQVCEDPAAIQSGTVVIRAHGVPPETIRQLEQAGLMVVDATCPHVLRSQRAIQEQSERGCQVVIAGDKDHAEVTGLLGYCRGPSAVVSSPEDAEQVELGERVCLIAQTTFNEATYQKIAEVIRRRRPAAEVLNTICRSTQERQDEARELARSVDAMVVVGAYHSANTRRLAEIARETQTPTFHVETADELDEAELAKYRTVGVTAGASTPHWITRSVIERLEGIGRGRTLGGLLWRAVDRLVQSSIYAGIGAMGLTYACYLLQQGRYALAPRWFLLISFCYIFSVHIWNRIGYQVGDPSAPLRLAFFTQHARLLVSLSVVLSTGSLVIASSLGVVSLVLLAGAYAIAVIYNVRVIPARWAWLPYQRLKDIPASKDVFSAAAWATVAVVLPSLSAQSVSVLNIAAAFGIACAVGFIRTTMLDFTDIQADRMIGRDTLPAVIGTSKTRRTLAVLAGALTAVLLAMTVTGRFSGLGYWLLLVPGYIFGYLYAYHRQVVAGETVCSLVADGTLVLMGVVAYGWQHV